MTGGRFLAVRPDAPWHDKFAGGGDQLLAAWLRMICRAKQMERSIFPSRQAMSDALSVDPEILADMIRRELVDERKGQVSIHDWTDHQITFNLERHRAQAAERKRRQRERQRSDTDG